MKNIRLDKYLSNIGFCSRKETAKLAKKWLISVNNNVIYKSDYKLSLGDIIEVLGEQIEVKNNIKILLNKPSGYVSSDVDEGNYKSYKKLIDDCIYKNMLSVAGRLDVDTEGLLVLLSDGKEIHQLISPKKGKEKIYYVELEKDILDEDLQRLEKGVKIQDDYITAPARTIKLENIPKSKIRDFGDFKEKTLKQIPDKVLKGEISILLSITEGKFHQIKKMAESIGNKVVYLKRLKVGNYELEDLKPGEWKYVD